MIYKEKRDKEPVVKITFAEGVELLKEEGIIIDPLEDIDTGKRGITSSGNQENTDIFNVPKYLWKYDTGSYFKSIKSGDISVRCVKGKINKEFLSLEIHNYYSNPIFATLKFLIEI